MDDKTRANTARLLELSSGTLDCTLYCGEIMDGKFCTPTCKYHSLLGRKSKLERGQLRVQTNRWIGLPNRYQL